MTRTYSIFIRFPSVISLYDEINVEMFLQRQKTQNNLTIQKGSIFIKHCHIQSNIKLHKCTKQDRVCCVFRVISLLQHLLLPQTWLYIFFFFLDCRVNLLFITNPECVKSQNNTSYSNHLNTLNVKPRPP